MPDRDNFPVIFDRLKVLFREFVPPLVVTTNTPDNYSLSVPYSAKYPKGFFCGAVQVRKNYVSYHLMPVYMFPDLLEGMSDHLKKRMQGKSCFNFTTLDEETIAELAQLTSAGFKRFRAELMR
jgi:hypothetical protein